SHLFSQPLGPSWVCIHHMPVPRLFRSKAWWLTHLFWMVVVSVVFFLVPKIKPGGPVGDRKIVTGTGAGVEPSLLGAGNGGMTIELAKIDSVGVGPGGVVSAEAMGSRISAALKVDDPVERMAAFADMLKQLNAENLPAALQAIEEGPRRDSDNELIRNFMRVWGKIDGKGAMDYALNLSGDRKFYVPNSDDSTIEVWAGQDPRAAMEYVRNVETKQNKPSLHHHVFKALLEQDVSLAAGFAMENKKSRERGHSIEALARHFAGNGGEAALSKWLNGIDREGENEAGSFQAYGHIMATKVLAAKDPQAAASWVEDFAADQKVDDSMFRYAAGALAKEDPVQAVDWLMEFPSTGDRSRALASTVERWADREPNEAGKWLASQNLGMEMDPAVSAFAREIVRDDPVSAMAWSQTIQNEKSRTETMIRVGRDWIRRDKGGVQDWLASADVPPKVGKYFERYFK
ncbi:MAG: hypothetical protein AAF514_24870, partial [Verrucomicrobiota bacterium]